MRVLCHGLRQSFNAFPLLSLARGLLDSPMSFDLFLVAFRDGGQGCADAEAARPVLERTRYEHRPEFNAYTIHFEDGSYVEMYAGGLHSQHEPFDGAMFAMRGFSDAIASFVFEFSRAAGCAIFPAMEPPCVLLPRDDLAPHLPAHLGQDRQRIPVASGSELLAALGDGYDSWQDYRDRVLRELDDDPIREA